MKFLFLCNKSPWPSIEGGSIAMSQLIEGLAERGHFIKILAVNSQKFMANSDRLPKNLHQKIQLEYVDIDLSVKLFPAFLNLFSSNSYHVQRFISEKFKTRLLETLQHDSFDIVQLETIFMAPYVQMIKENCSAKIVLRAHNIEHLIWKRIYTQSKNPLRKYYLRHLYKTLKTYELKAITKPDGLIPISDKDSSFFKKHTQVPVETIPFGMNTKIETINFDTIENALFHIGAMNWMPNLEGMKWFLKKVWPIVHQKHPELKLYLAGRAMPQWMKQLNMKNIEVIGEVENAEEFIQNKSIGIVPLRSGSGIRIKIIESMSLGKALVSTSIGAEGIDVQNNKHIKLADTPEEFAQAVSYLYTHPHEAHNMGKEAQNYIREKHNPKEIIDKLIGFYRQIS